ncbi:MAG TPA: glycosyltransferase N-terminal domain-containing protein, partial [Myxococcota bacterium]|nr:glycosyltransferase N-terminal domain-containing protein [Myxococcota bacterium]
GHLGGLVDEDVRSLQERVDLPILRTCNSATARNVDVGADQTLFLPFDNPLLLGRMLDRVRPRILILVEAELWPCLIAAAARRQIPVVVVGARVGAGLRRLAQLPGLWSSLREKLVWMPVDAEAAAFGGGEPTGDLKATAQSPTAPLRWKGDAVIGACTYVEEEGPLLEAIRKLDPRPLLVLAPRESDRFGTVAAWLQQQGEHFVRRSSLADGRVPAGVQVLLLDSFGELGGLYVHARAAFIGGTFVARVGGHSPMEAAAVGCPVVHGPQTRSNAAAFDALDSFLCLEPEDLAESLTEAMAAPRNLSAALQGQDRVEKVVDRLVPLLRPSAAPERWLRPLLWPLSVLWSLASALRPRPL